MWKFTCLLLVFSALLQSCASSSGLTAAGECDPSPLTLDLASVAPAAGAEPVWMVDGGFGCWYDDGPVKTLWIVDRRYAGSLEVRGESVIGESAVTFERGEAITAHLIVPNARQTSVIPGGASPSEHARYVFHPSYAFYPRPGCWRLTTSLGGNAVDIVVQQVLCDASGQPEHSASGNR